MIISEKKVRIFDITGKPMKGWLVISAEGTKGNGLQKWLTHSLAHIQTLRVK